MAQLDARPTFDQVVAGSTPVESANVCRGDGSWNIFYGCSLPLIQEGHLSFWRNNVHNTG